MANPSRPIKLHELTLSGQVYELAEDSTGQAILVDRRTGTPDVYTGEIPATPVVASQLFDVSLLAAEQVEANIQAVLKEILRLSKNQKATK